jgi:hypothetical protein
MIQHASETNEQAREKLKLIAKRYGLPAANVDLLSVEEVWEAVGQFNAGLLPRRLTGRQ